MTAELPAAHGEASRERERALVEQLVHRGVVSPVEVARAREQSEAGAAIGEGGAAESLLQTLTLSGIADARAILRVACAEQGIVDHFFAKTFPVVPRLLRRLPRERAVALAALPTVALDRDRGPAIIVSGRPLAADETAVLATYLGMPLAFLRDDPSEVAAAIQAAYDELEQRGRRDLRLGEMLVRDGIVDEVTVERALATSHVQRLRLGEALVGSVQISEPELYRYLAAKQGLPLLDGAAALELLDPDVAHLLPEKFCRHNRVLPYRHDGAAIRVLSSEPHADAEQVRHALKAKSVVIDLVTTSDLDRILRHLDRQARATEAEESPSALGQGAEEAVLLDVQDPLADTADSPDTTGAVATARYTKLADRLLAAAIRAGASDLHLEIYGKTVVVRFRIDGCLQDEAGYELTERDLRGLLNVFKIRSNLDIAERRLPQGGRMRKRTSQGDLYDFRVQTQPALHGEHIVIRLLAQSTPIRPLEGLGFSPTQTALVERIIRNPSGLCLITGPTGSGKTTTLYSLLDQLRQQTDLKVMTIEDPIEYGLDRVQQSQVRPEIGFGFAQAVRAFLREDPDVVLVGETRDPETALETIRASQTGHLVLSTVHANDAVDAIRRVLDLGVSEASLASELLAVIGQRLARRSCNACRERYTPNPVHLAELFPTGVPQDAPLTRGRGCPACRGTGFRGRVALLEVWLVGDAIRERIHRGASGLSLRRAAARLGLRSMVEDAAHKVLDGTTTIEEALSVIPYAKIEAEREGLQRAARRRARRAP